jgi:hypothetical protein
VGQASRLSRDDRLDACPTTKGMLPAGKRIRISVKTADVSSDRTVRGIHSGAYFRRKMTSAFLLPSGTTARFTEKRVVPST